MKPKIWGDVAKAAVPLSEVRKLNNTSLPYQSSAAGGEVNVTPGRDEVIIPEEKGDDVPTLYVEGAKHTAKTSGSKMYYAAKSPYVLKRVTKGTVYGGTGLNWPSVYSPVANTVLGYVHDYLGHGRFTSFADSGYHICQRILPDGALQVNAHTYVDGSRDVYVSVAMYEIRSDGNPAAQVHTGFNSGTLMSVSRMKRHTMSATLVGGTSAVTYLRHNVLGAYEAVFETPIQYCNYGCNAVGAASCGYFTLYPTGSQANGIDDNMVVFVVSQLDGANVAANGAMLTSSMDRPFYQFIGPKVALSPGNVIGVVSTGTSVHRYYIEIKSVSQSDSNDVQFRHIVCNHYGLNGATIDDAAMQTAVYTALSNESIPVPATPDILPEDAMKMYLLSTTTNGTSWSVNSIDPDDIYPDPIPYTTRNYDYQHEMFYWREYNTTDNNTLKAMTALERMRFFHVSGYVDNKATWDNWTDYTNYTALLVERSSMCVIAVNTVLWFIQSFVCAQDDQGSGNVFPDPTWSASNGYLKCLVHKSTNGGTSWTRMTGFPEKASDIFGIPFATSAEGADGYYRKVWRGDIGVEMTCLRPGVVMARCVKWGYTPAGGVDGGGLPTFTSGAGTRSVAFLLSTDGGASWVTPDMVGLPSLYLQGGGSGQLKVMSLVDGVSTIAMYVLDANTDRADLYTSIDDGYTWEKKAGCPVETSGNTWPYADLLSNESTPCVGWRLITNMDINAYGYWPMYPKGHFHNIMVTGEKCEKPADIALPWRLDASVAVP